MTAAQRIAANETTIEYGGKLYTYTTSASLYFSDPNKYIHLISDADAKRWEEQAEYDFCNRPKTASMGGYIDDID